VHRGRNSPPDGGADAFVVDRYSRATGRRWATRSPRPPPICRRQRHGGSAVASAPSARKRLTTALVWGLFLLALGTCVALVALSSMESRPPVNKARLLLNPRDIDIHLVNGNSCANWSSQHSYAVGLSLITTSLNTSRPLWCMTKRTTTSMSRAVPAKR
jgi:hypothetical protein